MPIKGNVTIGYAGGISKGLEQFTNRKAQRES